MAAGDEADRVAVLVEAVERGQEALARHAEDGVDALRDQRLDEGVAGGAGGGGGAVMGDRRCAVKPRGSVPSLARDAAPALRVAPDFY